MKPIAQPEEQPEKPTEGCWRVEGHCFDACPEGQKGEDGKPLPKWGEKRGRLLMSGTTIGKIQDANHPFKADGSYEECMKSLVFNDRKNFSAFVLALFKGGNDGEPIAAEMFEKQGHELDYPGLLISEKVPHVGGSPDGVARDRSYIIEIKTLMKRKIVLDEEGRARVPKRYLGQANFYMWLTNIPVCHFLQYDPQSGKLYDTVLDYDAEAMASALVRMYQFIDEVLHYRKRWRMAMNGLREGVEYLDRGIVVPTDPERRGVEEFTRIGGRIEQVEGRFGECLAAAREIVGSIDTYKPRAPPKKRQRAARREDPEVEAAAGVTEEELKEIQSLTEKIEE